MKPLACLRNIMLVFAATLTLLSCGNSNADIDKSKHGAPAADPVPVKIQEIQPSPFFETIQVVGIIKAYDDILLSAEEGGTIKEWRYRKGQFVPKDSIVAVLKDDVLKASFEAALAQYKMAEMNYEKQDQVFKEQGISKLQVMNAEYSRDAAKAQAELMKARWERTRLRSPVAGILEERYLDEAELAGPGVPVARIVNVSTVKVLITIPESYAGSMKQGAPMEFRVPALPGRVYTGTISYISSTVSPDNRALSAEAVVPNRDRVLRPEMVAKVTISQSVPRDALVVQEEFVQQLDQNRAVVYVIADQVAEERKVTLGGREKNTVEVLSGLRPGDKVVVSGYKKLVDGQAVKILQ